MIHMHSQTVYFLTVLLVIKYFAEVYKDHKISATNQIGKILESTTKKIFSICMWYKAALVT